MTDRPDFTQLRRQRILDATRADPEDADGTARPATSRHSPEAISGADAANETTANDSDRDRTPRGQRVMLREIEEEDRGRAENLMADTPPDADHAPEAVDLALSWASQTPARTTGAVQRTVRQLEGQVAADEAEITPLEAERMGLARSQRLSHEPAYRPETPTPEVDR